MTNVRNENDERTAREHNKPGKETPVYGSINEPPADAPKPFVAPETPAPKQPEVKKEETHTESHSSQPTRRK